MANKTSNYGLTKPLQTEFYDIDVHNANMDIIDTQLKNVSQKVDNLSTDADDLTGTLPIEHGGTGATTASGALSKLGAAPSNHEHYYAGSANLGGSANSAEKLTTGRTIKTDLGNTSAVSFDGTKDVTVGVTGTLPVANGGTGATKVSDVQSAFGIVPMNDIPNLHIWGKYTGNPSGYTLGESKTTTISSNNTVNGITVGSIYYSDEIKVTNGRIHHVNIQSIGSSNFNDETLSVLKGKFVGVGELYTTFYYVSPNATFEINGAVVKASAAQLVTVNSSEPLGYVASKENNTYPTNGQHTDGYWYVYCKQLGESEHTFGTTDLTAGSSAIETGRFYWVYE